MRKATSIILIGLLFLAMSSLVFANLQDFSGRWTNIDSNTRGITALNINSDPSGRVYVQAWGQAHPSDIDWGMNPAYAYASSVDNPIQGAQVITVIFQTNFSETILIIRSQRTELQAETFTRFTDNSMRSNYNAVYRFRRARGGNNWPGLQGHQGPQDPQWPQGQQWPNQLGTPQQIAPINGSVFNYFPRRTNLSWSPVNGAQRYCVEIDYYDTSWITDQGKTYIIVPNLTTTSYSFNFVGAQPGRWRVWAVDAGGQEGPKSGWWEFRYMR